MNKYAAIGIAALALLGFVGWLITRRSPKEAVPFRMPVDDVFAITNLGKVVVVGVVAEGEIRPGHRLVIRSSVGQVAVVAEALEAIHKPLRYAKKGDQVGVMLTGVDKDQIGTDAELTSP